MSLNVFLSGVIIVSVIFFIYFMFFRKTGIDLEKFEEDDADKFSEQYIKTTLIDEFDNILQTDYSELNLNKLETMKNERNQSKLRKALKECATGNAGSKAYVKDYIKDLLRNKFNIVEETITKVIPFDAESVLTSQDKFEILLYLYKQKYGDSGFKEMANRNGFTQEIGSGAEMYYAVTAEDINLVYSRHKSQIELLDYYDRLNIVTQRIYQITYGLGCIDEIRDQTIDGINCGTSGIPSTFYIKNADAQFGAPETELPYTSYNAVWVMLSGKMIHMRCLGFGTERELQRVAKLVYRYDNPGTLDRATGYMVNFMQDGSRVTVARPDMAESWMFYIRKFDSASKMSFEQMYPFKYVNKLIETLRWIVSGQRNIAITGAQATGKSTLLGSMIQFMPASQSIRVEEMAFELHLRKIYPTRNIATFRQTNTVSAQEGIDFMKKTDGTIGVFGEIAQAVVAALAIQMGEVGMSQVMFTHHAKTAPDLVKAFRDNMIEAAGFNNEAIVEATVARVLNFDVHLARSLDGVRYIQRITEICPLGEENYPSNLEEATKEYYFRSTDRAIFEYHDILVWDNGVYRFVGLPSDYSIGEIKKCLSVKEQKEYDDYLAFIKEEIGVM